MKKDKRIISVILLILIMTGTGFCACGNPAERKESQQSSVESTAESMNDSDTESITGASEESSFFETSSVEDIAETTETLEKTSEKEAETSTSSSDGEGIIIDDEDEVEIILPGGQDSGGF